MLWTQKGITQQNGKPEVQSVELLTVWEMLGIYDLQCSLDGSSFRHFIFVSRKSPRFSETFIKSSSSGSSEAGKLCRTVLASVFGGLHFWCCRSADNKVHGPIHRMFLNSFSFPKIS